MESDPIDRSSDSSPKISNTQFGTDDDDNVN